MLQTSPLSTLSAPEMRAIHNLLAEERGRPLVSRRLTDRAMLGKRIALLRTMRPPSPIKKTRQAAVADKRRSKDAPVRFAALEELARVCFYQNQITAEILDCDSPDGYSGDEWFAVGYSYAEVTRRVKARIPDSTVTVESIRFIALQVRAGADGYGDCLLPDIRPHSAKGRTNGH